MGVEGALRGSGDESSLRLGESGGAKEASLLLTASSPTSSVLLLGSVAPTDGELGVTASKGFWGATPEAGDSDGVDTDTDDDCVTVEEASPEEAVDGSDSTCGRSEDTLKLMITVNNRCCLSQREVLYC